MSTDRQWSENLKLVEALKQIKFYCDIAEVGRKGIAIDQISELANKVLREYAEAERKQQP